MQAQLLLAGGQCGPTCRKCAQSAPSVDVSVREREKGTDMSEACKEKGKDKKVGFMREAEQKLRAGGRGEYGKGKNKDN